MVSDALHDELERWRAAGRQAKLWWRDDDAAEDSAALGQLLDLQRQSTLPLAIAAVGGNIETAMAERVSTAIDRGQEVYILSHGYRHQNHAAAGEKKNEFPSHRLVYDMLADIALGFEGLKVHFGDHALPVFVPPWNRFAHGMVPRLQNAQIRAYSAYGPVSDLSDYGLVNTNCQVDIINWRGDRGFLGQAMAEKQLIAALEARRESGAGDAVGILSHHREHDDDCWGFLADLFEFSAGNDAVHWQNPLEAFNLPS